MSDYKLEQDLKTAEHIEIPSATVTEQIKCTPNGVYPISDQEINGNAQLRSQIKDPSYLWILRPKSAPLTEQSSTACPVDENISASLDPMDPGARQTVEHLSTAEQATSVDEPCTSEVLEASLHADSKQVPKQRTHTCEYCAKRFLQRSHLRTHIIAVHLKQRDHKCEHCGKLFFLKALLQTHVRAVHLKQGTFTCDYCEKPFYLKSHLQYHVASVHLMLPAHMCEHCKRSFYRINDLQRHLKFVHSDPVQVDRTSISPTDVPASTGQSREKGCFHTSNP
ncbi:unnamed protein product [Dicrocoelium dendriticum]|nr:unnamed protein product [Dicrocoelium dendriticum]